MKKGLLLKLLFLVSSCLLLNSCVISFNPIPDVEIVKAVNQFNSAVYANDEGSNGFFVKRVVDGIIGCYNVSWNWQTNKIDNSALNNGELVFDLENEHLKPFNITDFELLSVYVDNYYYVYIMANNKIYEYVADYKMFPLSFTYINFREINTTLDGFNKVINARYNSLILENDDEPLLEDIPNSLILSIYGMNYLYLESDGSLVYQNISKTKPIKHVFIEDSILVKHVEMNNNYALVLTVDNKIYKLDFKELTVTGLKFTDVSYMTTTMSKNYFVVVDSDVIKVYNYMLTEIAEIIPTKSTSEIVGLCINFQGSTNPKRIVLSINYLDGNVLYQEVEEINLSNAKQID